MLELTAEQKQALALDKNLAVTAGAGSGKTMVLTSRYLKILEECANRGYAAGIPRILVLTFTEKAAAEMKERIFNAICQWDELKRGAIWKSFRNTFMDNQISTFHSFCARILRAHPIEAGVDPEFEVLEGYEQQLLLGEAVEKKINYLARQKDEDLRSLLRIWSRQEVLRNLEKLISNKNKLATWFERYQKLSPENCLEEWFSPSVDVEKLLAADSELLQEIEKLKPLGQLPIDPLDSGMILVRELIELYNYSLTPPPEDRLHGFFVLRNLLEIFLDSRGQYKKMKHHSHIGTKGNWQGYEETWENMKERARTIRDMLAEKIPAREIFSLPAEIDYEYASLLSPLIRLSLACQDNYEALKAGKGCLDFADLEDRASHLIMNNEEVRQKLAQNYHYIMVDEFQDTNEAQWQMVRALSSSENGELEKDKLFLVGDVKQSIYSFRGGDVKVFSRAIQELAEAGKVERITFTDNFRSCPEPIDFFNSFFASLLGKENLKDFEAPFQELKKAGEDRKPPGKVTISFLLPGQSSLQDREREASLVAQKVLEGLEGISEKEKPPRVCILLRRLTNVGYFEEALDRKGLSYTTVQGRGFFQRQEIFDLANLLAFLDDRSQDRELVGILRSPLLGVDDCEIFSLQDEVGETLFEKLQNSSRHRLKRAGSLLQKWLKLKSYQQPSVLMQTVLRESGYYYALYSSKKGEQQVQNVEKLLETARNFQARGGGLAEFVDFLKQQIAQESLEGEAYTQVDTDVVIMTIHQAKGLEFPCVIVPELGGKFNTGLRETLLIREVEGQEEVAFNVPDPRSGIYTSPMLREKIKKQVVEEEKAEEKRLLYVAATRAQELLYLIGNWGDKESLDDDLYNMDSFSQWIRAVYDLRGKSPKAGQLTNNLDRASLEICSGDLLSPDQERDKNLKDFIDSLNPEKFQGLALPKPEYTLPFTLSPSALSLYWLCPLQYRYRHGLFLREDMVKRHYAPAKKRDIDPLVLGNILHRLLEKGVYSPEQKDFSIILKQHLLAEDREMYQQVLEKHLKNLDKGGWFRRLPEAKYLYRELPFRVFLGENSKQQVYLKGVMDILLQEGDTWQVVDFKTGSNQASTEEMGQYQIQMQCYILAAGRLLGRKEAIEKGTLVFTENGREEEIKPREDDQKILWSLARRILADEYGPETGKHCGYCQYRPICPAIA